MEADRETLLKKAAMCGIPDYMIHSVIAYILEGRAVGHFLTAVFSNDLKEACNRADEENAKKIYNYVSFLYNNAPIGCWGSPDSFKRWLEVGGLEGLFRGKGKIEGDEPKSGSV